MSEAMQPPSEPRSGAQPPLDPAGHVDAARFSAIEELFEELEGGVRGCMLEPFLRMLELHVPRIENARHSGDLETLWQSAHALKGGSRDLGFSRLGDLAEALERPARGGMPPPDGAFGDLFDEVDWARVYVSTF